MWTTSERMKMTPRVILILKQASSAARLHKTLAQKLHVTVAPTLVRVSLLEMMELSQMKTDACSRKTASFRISRWKRKIDDQTCKRNTLFINGSKTVEKI